MKNRKSFIFFTVLLIGVGWFFWHFETNKPNGSSLPRTSVISRAKSQNDALSKTVLDALYTPAQIRAGQTVNAMLYRNPSTTILLAQLLVAGVSKQDLTKGILDAQNAQSLSSYGRVIDQYGDPVANAAVAGNALLNEGIEDSKYETHATTTDSQGFFQFIGLHGISLGISLKKEGYETNNGGFHGAQGTAGPNNRDTYVMWKLQGAEPMAYSKFGAWIPYDGTPININLLTGKKDDEGDFKLTLLRNPVQIVRGREHFDWDAKIEIVGGGLAEENDPYPYLAPESGYAPSFEYTVKKDDPHWTQKLVRNFYVKTSKGVYGRIHIDLTTDSDRSEGTGFSVEAWINASPNSRNLEFDAAKEIKVK